LLAASLVKPASQWGDRAPTTVAQLLTQLDRVGASLPLWRPAEVAPPAPTSRQKAAAPAQPPAPPAPDPIRTRIADEGIALTRVVLGQTLSFTLSATATVILLYFLLASEHWMVSRAVEAVPRHRTRAMILSAIRRAEREIGHFLATLTLINIGVGVAAALAMWMLGLPNPALWGTLAATLNFIPYLGPIAMDAMLLLAGILSFDTIGAMLAPAAAFIVIHATESSLISPWLVGRRLSLSPVAVFVAVMCMGALWGVAGAVLTVPILVGIRCGLRRVRALRLPLVFLEGGAENAPTLASLLQRRRRGARGRISVPPS